MVVWTGVTQSISEQLFGGRGTFGKLKFEVEVLVFS